MSGHNGWVAQSVEQRTENPCVGGSSGRDLGIVQPFGQFKNLFGGMLLGFCSLAIVVVMAIGFGDRAFSQNLTAYKIFGTVFSAMATAVVVATLEEILFRGGVF